MLRRKIKKQREDAIYKQRKRRQRLLDALIIIAGVIVSSGIIYGTVILIKGA